MSLLKTLYLATSIAAVTLLTTRVSASELNVRIEGIAHAGTIHVYVFTSPEGFPKEENAAVHQSYPGPSGAQSEIAIQISAPDASEYVVMAYQDLDGNGKMNRLLGMIPQEPYGLSRNPQLFGKPKFLDAAIKVSDGELVVLKMHD
jgi:uncharacterized protein (DUF2141 family)